MPAKNAEKNRHTQTQQSGQGISVCYSDTYFVTLSADSQFYVISCLAKNAEKNRQTRRSSMIRVFPVCYTDTQFVTSSAGNQYCILNFRTLVVSQIPRQTGKTLIRLLQK